MVKVFVPRERAEGETRVAATPETVKRLVKEGLSVKIEAGAGERAHLSDAAYEQAGATLVQESGLAAAFAEADAVLKVGIPTEGPAGHEADLIREGALLLGFASTHKNPETIKKLRDRKVSFAAVELIPRISRAQSMDALSSQAGLGGYKAVLLAASHLDKYFPLMMTAAGTIQPAKVVIMGAGVAGLNAIATAKRLGAVVEVSDVRPAVKEQVASLGGRFIEVDLGEAGEGEGGYARELTPEQLEKQKAVVRERVVAADVVITTALVPGRPAPRLITADMVEEMRPGAVIVDMAVEQGGNCELSELNKTVVKHGVTIIGRSDLPASMPLDASLMYARNLQTLLLHLYKDGAIHFDFEDEITNGALLTHEGEIRHKPTAELVGA